MTHSFIFTRLIYICTEYQVNWMCTFWNCIRTICTLLWWCALPTHFRAVPGYVIGRRSGSITSVVGSVQGVMPCLVRSASHSQWNLHQCRQFDAALSYYVWKPSLVGAGLVTMGTAREQHSNSHITNMTWLGHVLKVGNGGQGLPWCVFREGRPFCLMEDTSLCNRWTVSCL